MRKTGCPTNKHRVCRKGERRNEQSLSVQGDFVTDPEHPGSDFFSSHQADTFLTELSLSRSGAWWRLIEQWLGLHGIHAARNYTNMELLRAQQRFKRKTDFVSSLTAVILKAIFLQQRFHLFDDKLDGKRRCYALPSCKYSLWPIQTAASTLSWLGTDWRHKLAPRTLLAPKTGH